MSTEVFTVAQLVQIQIVETETGLAIFIYLVYFFLLKSGLLAFCIYRKA